MARTVDVTPSRWLPKGEVLVEVPGRLPLVVWSGIPGERARVRVSHLGHHQARGEWLSSERPDPHRVTPPCEKYTPCGGCPLMHLDLAGQQAARRHLVAEALRGEGLDQVKLGAWHASPDGATDFRHTVKVGFTRSDFTGRLKVGAWGRNSREIVPVPQCNVAAPALRKTMVSLAHHAISMGIEAYDPETNRGVLRAAILRSSRTTGEVMITLVAGQRDRSLTELAEEVARGVSEVVGIWLHLNDDPGNNILSRDADGTVGVVPLVGKEWIEERLGDIAYRIGPGDFFQTNPAMAEVLYARVIDRLALAAGDTVLDLYCGVGGLALPAAKITGFALGVEEVDGAVQRAREGARLNRVPAEFVSGRVLDVLAEITPRFAGTGPKLIVDPARRGLEDGVGPALLPLEPARIAYVSCNPKAMARDLASFAGRGWRIGEIELFDMFPNTAHVECLAILDPPASATPASRRGPQRRLAR